MKLTNRKARKMVSQVIAIVLMAAVLCGCAKEQKKKEPTPITVRNPDITDTVEFQRAVAARMDELLSGEVSLTVYLDNAEDFQYIGTLEVIDDGSTGTRPVIFIHADRKTVESEWW